MTIIMRLGQVPNVFLYDFVGKGFFLKTKKKQRTAPAETVDINSAKAAVVAIKRFILCLFVCVCRQSG